MLCICQEFAQEYNISFNPTKTKCIKFGSCVKINEKVFLNNSPIEWVNQVQHLGNVVNSSLNDHNDTESKCSSFNGSVNKMLGSYSGVNVHIMSLLFQSHCCPFYGSQLWDLTSRGFNSCCKQWNKAVRRIFNLPYRTHTWLLGPLIGKYHISVQLYVKTLRFTHYMLNSTNPIVSYIGHLAKSNSSSPIGKNMAYLRYKYGILYTDRLSCNINKILDVHTESNEQQAIISVVNDIIDISNKRCSLQGFPSSSLDSILHDVCVN